MKNFDNYTFRCSSLGKLMTSPRNMSELLSETTKSYLRDIFIEVVYGRKRINIEKYTSKGTLVEEDSLTLVTQELDTFLKKNTKRYTNSYIGGTPDVVYPELIDIKSCWDIWTFASTDGTNRDYYWQLQGYMWLTKKRKASLIYTLVDTPGHLIENEKRSLAYKSYYPIESPEFQELEAQVDKNMTFSDIHQSERIKTYKFEYSAESIKELKKRIEDSRGYLNYLLSSK